MAERKQAPHAQRRKVSQNSTVSSGCTFDSCCELLIGLPLMVTGHGVNLLQILFSIHERILREVIMGTGKQDLFKAKEVYRHKK